MKTLLTLLSLLCSWATAQTLVPVAVTGDNDKRINIVFLSEGYTTASMPAFSGHVNTAMEYLLSREPWRQYRSYCNVYRVEVASAQNGTDNGAAGGTRNTYFSSGFITANVDQLCTLTAGGQTAATTLLNSTVPGWDVAIVLVNDTKYGGSGGPISVATIHEASGMIVEHEIGHSLVDLADEYDIFYSQYAVVEKINNTAQTSRNLVKWKHWFEVDTPVPTPEYQGYNGRVGLFEGSMYRMTGWYRPHEYSMMQGLGAECGQVNREAFVLKFYSLVAPVDSYTPAGNFSVTSSLQNVNLSLNAKVPSEGPPLSFTWRIDNVVQAAETGPSLTLLSDAIGNGSHAINVTVKDPTPFVRLDPSSRLQETKTWTVNLSNQMPNTLPAWRTDYGADLANSQQDGMANVMKYALGIRPTLRATAQDFPSGGRTAADGNEYLTLTVPRKWKRADVDYVVETSGTIGGWNSGPGHTVVLSDTTTNLVVRDAVPIGSTSKRFIRLRVTPR